LAPDETTICKFRHFLEKHKLSEKLSAVSQQHLEERGLLVKSGTIVDATIISAPTSTKNKDRKRDPEMKSTRKGNQWYFGMKAHIGTDTQGLVHSVEVTSADVHNSVVMPDCMHGEEQVVYGDKAYVNKARKAEAEARGVEWRVSRKATRKRKLNCAGKSFNRKSNRTRAKVEHAFGVIKNLWGYRKVRYRGLAKNAGRVYTLLALANIYMTRKQLGVC
jgi:IS5 family transposase